MDIRREGSNWLDDEDGRVCADWLDDEDGRACADWLNDGGMRYTSTALYFYGAS